MLGYLLQRVTLRFHSLPLPLSIQVDAAHRGVCLCVCVHSYVHMCDVSNLGTTSLSFEALTVSV